MISDPQLLATTLHQFFSGSFGYAKLLRDRFMAVAPEDHPADLQITIAEDALIGNEFQNFFLGEPTAATFHKTGRAEIVPTEIYEEAYSHQKHAGRFNIKGKRACNVEYFAGCQPYDGPSADQAADGIKDRNQHDKAFAFSICSGSQQEYHINEIKQNAKDAAQVLYSDHEAPFDFVGYKIIGTDKENTSDIGKNQKKHQRPIHQFVKMRTFCSHLAQMDTDTGEPEVVEKNVQGKIDDPPQYVLFKDPVIDPFISVGTVSQDDTKKAQDKIPKASECYGLSDALVFDEQCD